MTRRFTPGTTRVLALCDPDYPTVPPALLAIESMAASLGIKVVKGGIKNKTDIEQSIRNFATEPNGGLTVIQSGGLVSLRATVVKAALEHKLPGVFPFRSFVASGGLASYGING
jgi:putative ABC transport system substrate-binding protein